MTKWKATLAIAGIAGVITAYALYLCLTPDPQDGILFGSVMAVIGLLAGVNVKEFVKTGGR